MGAVYIVNLMGAVRGLSQKKVFAKINACVLFGKGLYFILLNEAGTNFVKIIRKLVRAK